ncbi:hypothetical protein NUACC21_60620 [Scytonema sp. NUACC21]
MTASHNLGSKGFLKDSNVATLVDILQGRALHQPDQKAFIFLQDGEIEEVSVTYRELDLQARAIAAMLQSLEATGERALLLYPPGLEFIAAFFGCLYAGVVAIPAYQPRSNNQSMDRLLAILEDAQTTLVLTSTNTLSYLERRFGDATDLAAIRLLTTDNVALELAQAWQTPEIDAETLAYLQYTSGSTSKPKGVKISHRNAIANSLDIALGHETNSESVLVSWLPHFHDFGLVYGIIQPVHQGCPCVVMAPTSFIQQPIRWLQAISRYRATHSGAPNFAYELCTSKITPEQCTTLDLSSWCVAANGAEPIRQETLQRFVQTFEPYGFRWQTFCPSYGLAEATLKVTSVGKTEMPIFCTVEATALERHQIIEISANEAETRMLVGCGSTLVDTKIAIANPTSRTTCLPNQVGEIWVSSASVSHGYWNRPEETERTFGAYLADTREGPFLRTGDLGFIKNGQLFVTGRLKDLIIIRGYNHYPQDIELTVENSHSALRSNCTAAFSVDVNGEERLVIATEVERSHLRNLNVDEVIGEIRLAVAQQHELQVYAVLLLKTGTIPKTSSGKIQRQPCRAGFLSGSLNVVGEWTESDESLAKLKHLQAEVETLMQQLETRKQYSFSSHNHSNEQKNLQPGSQTAQAIQAWLVSKIAERLRVNPHDINVREPFIRYGLDSMAVVSLTGELENWLKRKLSPTLVYDYPSIESLARYIAGESDVSESISQVDANRDIEREAIAIIGMGCRFPHAKDPEAFWHLLHSQMDAITEVPEARWNVNTFYDSNPATPGKMVTRWGGFLDQVDQFDPLFFGISPREAQRMDPQQRLLLEVAWEALENAGIAPDKLAGSQTGVFIGISTNDYSRLQFEDYAQIDAYAGTGNAFSITANRLSYLLDLRGPSLAVDTACSSSLVAVHLACQNLRHGECNMALAGGVNLILSPELNITFSKAQMMSADGRCKTFDANADGYVRGEGCGVVLLKRLSDAVRDGDNILALIRGSAINQDGRSNGLTAPNGPSQQAVIRQALKNALVAPEEINYVETHGTGTSLGDPIEVDSLKVVLMPNRSKNEPCAIGSVKANIGHLEAAAGIASLIKVVLALQHEEIPAQLHVNQLNPHISLEGTSLFIPKKGQPWFAGSKRRLAGLSSFGFGGTNAHVVLEEPPLPTKADINVDVPSGQEQSERPLHLLTLSAKSDRALQSLVQSYQGFLETHPQVSLADVCFTANTGRSHFSHRLAIVTESTVQLQAALSAFLSGKQVPELVSGQVHSTNRPKIVFLFTGQGSQYPNMGRQLYETQPIFRQTLDRCDELLRPYLELPLLSVLYPKAGITSPLDETAYTQPALFALEYALFQLWLSWGIVPDAVMGHSLGEYVAACVAGVFSLENALKLVALRSRLMQSLPHNGEMAVVFAPYERVASAVAPYEEQVAIAAVNGPENTVISGVREQVQLVAEELKSEGGLVQPMQVSHAFHSQLVDPILNEFESLAATIKFHSPNIALISNLTGKMFQPGEIPDASYWRRHMRSAVQFQKGIDTLIEQGCELFVELGPQPTLLGMGKRCLPKGIGTWLPSLQKDRDNWQTLLNSASTLYVKGVDADWTGFDGGYRRCRIPLPTYPFERHRYWFESNKHRDKHLIDVRESNPQMDVSVYKVSDTTPVSTLEETPLQSPAEENLPKSDSATQFLQERGLVSEATVERIMTRQIEALTQFMSRQLEVLQKNSLSAHQGLLSETSQSVQPANYLVPPSSSSASDKVEHPKTTVKPQVEPKIDAKQSFGLWKRNTEKSSVADIKSGEIKTSQNTKQEIQFSLFYFGNYESEFIADKYNLLFEGAKFADEHDFAALWIPERHFHAFGGFSPNPSVISAALAKVTQRIQLRAGSVVLPLHHPIRVAEEWSVVDNLSKGRVGIAFASGWHANDFVFSPESYGNHRELMFQGIETVQKLWRGESISVIDGAKSNISVKLFPMPMQSELPIWLTIVNNPETYIKAGEMGAGVLTNLMGQTIEDLAKNIALYRESLAKHGYDPESGSVTVLLHTFVGNDVDKVREKARKPFYEYLQSSVGLFQNLVKSQGLSVDFNKLSQTEREYIFSTAYERYIGTSALIGTPESCSPIIDKLIAIGVDEIACFVDFGVDTDSVLEGLNQLNSLKEQYKIRSDAAPKQFLSHPQKHNNWVQQFTDWIPNLELSDEQQPEQIITENPDNCLYEVTWQPQPLPLEKQDELLGNRGTWLILADTSGVGQQLADLLVQREQRCILVYPGEAYQRVDEGHFYIHPERAEDMQLLLKMTLGVEQPPCRGIVHLWSLNILAAEDTSIASLDTAQILGCNSIIHLVRELERSGWGETVRLWLVTQGTQMVESKPMKLAIAKRCCLQQIAQAPLWGLGLTISQEHSTFWGGLVDLDPQAPIHDSSVLLWQQICSQDGEDRVAFREKQRYVARLVRKHESTLPAAPLLLHSDGSYLITGGLGDLGLLVARWMVEQGAKRLILLGRTQLPERTYWNQVEKDSRLGSQITAIQELESFGASVYLASVDVASEAQMKSFIEAFHRSGWPPIRGVVHAAGLVQDRTLVELDPTALNEVWRPKVVGSLLLHQLLENAPLDFFVLFSSMSSLLPQPGQGNYAAANAFLDALAHHRQIEGRPALSINWPLWALATKAGEKRLAKYLTRMGIRNLESKLGLELLGKLLPQHSAQVAVIPVNWSQLRDVYPAARKIPLLSYLLQEELDVLLEPESVQGKERLTRDVLIAAEPEKQQRLLESYLSKQVAGVLGLTVSQLDVHQPLNKLGLDSLMAVELKNRIENDLGVVVSVVSFLQGPSVTKLTTQLLEQIATPAVELALPVTLSQSTQNVNQFDGINTDNTEYLLAKLNQLSEEEVDSLLSSIQAEKEVQECE